MQKLVIFGIDGGCWDLINSLIDENKLPNLKKMIGNGVSGNLQSTIPPITGPAWASFATGKKPENHGIYDFVTHDEKKSRLMTSKNIRGETFYEILSHEGFRSVLIGLPLSYPPKKINGIILADVFSPKKFAYPQSANKYLEEYQWAPNTRLEGAQLINELISFTNSQMKVAKKIFKNEQWDLFFILFPASDAISHKHYGDMVRRSKIGIEAIKIFQKIDESIGWFLKHSINDITFFLLSDHGFQECTRTFFINSYLKNKNLLDVKLITKDRIKEVGELRKNIEQKEVFINKNLYIIFKINWIRKFAWNIKLIINKIMMGRFQIKTGYIPDPEKSKLYMPTLSSYCLNINDSNEKLINKIITLLKTLRDPTNEKKIFADVFYVNLNNLERIYFDPTLGYNINTGITDEIFTTVKNNMHKRTGIFIAYGEGVKSGKKINDNNIYDLTPTILKMFNIEIPLDIDGRFITDIFSKDLTDRKMSTKELKLRKDKREIRKEIMKLKKI